MCACCGVRPPLRELQWKQAATTFSHVSRPPRESGCTWSRVRCWRLNSRPQALDPTPALTNVALFARDQHLCLYCGREFHRQQLTRDHVMPLSQGGRDHWENVVAACFHCNSRKGGRTPQQASMPLLAVPYRPSWIEHLILSNRNILADQMAFLKSHLPKRKSRFH